MTDLELAEYLGIAELPSWQKVISRLSSERRAVYERMKKLEGEIDVWRAGGPFPSGVLIDLDDHRARRRMRQ